MSEVRPLRAYAEVELGRQRSPQHEIGTHMTKYLRAANVKDGQLDLTDVKEMNFTPAERARFELRPGDVLVTEGSGSLSAVGASAVWRGELDGPVCFQNTLLRLRPRPGTGGRFLAWWCRYAYADGLFASAASGTNIFHLSAERVRALPVTYLPLHRQRAIADFLDAETTRIDALLQKRSSMRALLDEALAARAERMVLGLDRHDLVAASAVQEWVPVVPSSWRVTSLRHLGCSVQTGPFRSQLHASDYVEGGWPVVNPANLRGGKIRADSRMTVSDEKRGALARHILRTGDIVFGRRGEMGRAGLVTDEQEGWLCGTGSLRLRLHTDRLLPGFLKALLETRLLRSYFELESVGSTMDNLNADIVLSAPVVLPPVEEQRQVVEELSTATRLNVVLTDRLDRQIALLRERRQALITAAVTGELDVPGAEAA